MQKKSSVMCYFTGVTILLSLTVLQNFVQDTLPQVSDAMPLLGTFGLNYLIFFNGTPFLSCSFTLSCSSRNMLFINVIKISSLLKCLHGGKKNQILIALSYNLMLSCCSLIGKHILSTFPN